MAMIVVDTDVLIDFMFGKGPGDEMLQSVLGREDLHTTAVTFYEFLVGNAPPRLDSRIRGVLENLVVLPLDERSARCAADVRRNLRREHHDIGMADCLIVGTVLTHGGILMTRNFRHFNLVEGLRIYRFQEGG